MRHAVLELDFVSLVCYYSPIRNQQKGFQNDKERLYAMWSDHSCI